MANGTVSAPAKSAGAPSKILNLLSKITWYELLAVPVIAVVAAIFWFKEAITEAFWEAQERTTTSFGVGMMPLGIWAGVFVAVMMIKPSLFRHYRYWLASALFVLLALGLLSLFRPLEGPLAWFTLDGYVSLGGTVGETIAGHVLWQQILRLGSLAILAVAVLSPAFAALLAIATGRLVTYACIGVLLLARGVGSQFRRKDRDPEPSLEAADGIASSNGNAISDYGHSELGSENENPADYSRRPVSKFAMAVATAPLSIESTMSESASDRASPGPYSTDAPVAELRRREETDMQANTDFDFGFSHAAGGAAIADADVDEYSLDDDQAGGYEYDEDDIGGQFQEIENLTATQPSSLTEDESERSGFAVRLLGTNRPEWSKPSIEMLEGVQDRGVPEDQIRETAETIRQTLADYDIEVEIGSIKYGPTVTMYGIIPG